MNGREYYYCCRIIHSFHVSGGFCPKKKLQQAALDFPKRGPLLAGETVKYRCNSQKNGDWTGSAMCYNNQSIAPPNCDRMFHSHAYFRDTSTTNRFEIGICFWFFYLFSIHSGLSFASRQRAADWFSPGQRWTCEVSLQQWIPYEEEQERGCSNVSTGWPNGRTRLLTSVHIFT